MLRNRLFKGQTGLARLGFFLIFFFPVILSCEKKPAFQDIKHAPATEEQTFSSDSVVEPSDKNGERYYSFNLTVDTFEAQDNPDPVELLFVLDTSASMIDNLERLANSVGELANSLRSSNVPYTLRILNMDMLERQLDVASGTRVFPLGLFDNHTPNYQRENLFLQKYQNLNPADPLFSLLDCNADGNLDFPYSCVQSFTTEDGASPVSSAIMSKISDIEYETSERNKALENEFGFCSFFDYLEWLDNNPSQSSKKYSADQRLHLIVLTDEDNGTQYQTFDPSTGNPLFSPKNFFCFQDKKIRKGCSTRNYEIEKEWTEYNYTKRLRARDRVYDYLVRLQRFWYDYEVTTLSHKYKYDIQSRPRKYSYSFTEQPRVWDYQITTHIPGEYQYTVTFDRKGICQKNNLSSIDSENMVGLYSTKTCGRKLYRCPDTGNPANYVCEVGAYQEIFTNNIENSLRRCNVAQEFSCRLFF